jgi:hypothetical protein
MITAATGPGYHVIADEPQLIAEHLDAAGKLAWERALREDNHRILVTRHERCPASRIRDMPARVAARRGRTSADADPS